LLAKLLADRKTVLPWQKDVQQYNVGLVIFDIEEDLDSILALFNSNPAFSRSNAPRL